MRRILPLLLLDLILVFSGRGLAAQNPLQASVTAHASAEVIEVFSASETTELYFGRFSPGPQGGEILLTPESTISVLGSVYAGTGTHNAASFYITGEPEGTYSITLPSENAVLTHTESTRTLTVKDWISVPEPGIATGKLENGYQTVQVGATLIVGTLEDNPPGIYTGSYIITFEFN